MKKKLNRKGFTLIELLAVIAVLSVVFSVTMYVVTNTVSKAREKSYQVTINNIEKGANTYLIENKDKLVFVANGTTEYQCVTVQNLIDLGYLDTIVINSPVSNENKVGANNYIYVSRDSTTKAIINSVYLNEDSEYNAFCASIIRQVDGTIRFKSVPSTGEWAREKEITITYRARNYSDASLLSYYYTFGDYSENNNNSTKVLTVSENGTIQAQIRYNGEEVVSSNLNISKIDRVGPIVRLGTIATSYVSNEAIIPLVVTDVGSGVEYNTFTKDDIDVTVGGSTIDKSQLTLKYVSGDNYQLIINEPDKDGQVFLVVHKDGIFDKVENGNERVELTPDITFDNGDTIGNLTTTNDLKMIKQTATLSCEDSGGVAGYYWGTTAPTETSTYTSVTVQTSVTINKDVTTSGTYYLVCKDRAGNTSDVVSQTYHTYKVNTMLIKVGGGSAYTTDNFAQSKTVTYIALKGTNLVWESIYTIPTGSSASRFSGVSSGQASTTEATLNKDNVLLNSDLVFSLWFTRNTISIGYKLNSNNGEVLRAETTNADGTKTYTWSTDENGLITRATNGGTPVVIKTSVQYGQTTMDLANPDNTEYLYITKAGHKAVSGAEWACTGCKSSTQKFKKTSMNITPANICSNIATEDCNISVSVNWGAVTYTINYYLGNGTGTKGSTKIGSSTCKYGESCTLKSWAEFGKVFPYSEEDHNANDAHNNYSWAFAGWSTSQTGTNRNYNDEATFTFTRTSTLNLYAVGTRKYYFYGGTDSTLISSPSQYWNPYSTSTTYMTSITIPAATAIASWTFCGYKAADSTAGATQCNSPTYAASTAGTSQTPPYNNWPVTRSVYKRNLTVSYNANGGSGTTNPTTLIQYFNTGYSAANSQISSHSITLASNAFTKSGSTFSQWAEGSTSGKKYSAGATYSGIGTTLTDTTVSKTMYATWTANSGGSSGGSGGTTDGSNCSFTYNTTLQSGEYCTYTCNGKVRNATSVCSSSSTYIRYCADATCTGSCVTLSGMEYAIATGISCPATSTPTPFQCRGLSQSSCNSGAATSYCSWCQGGCYPKASCPTPTPGPSNTSTPKPSGSGGCFLAGTKVQTVNGEKGIDEINVGDMVLSYNDKTRMNEYHKVIDTLVYGKGEIDESLYTLTFDDNTTLKITSSHRLYVERDNMCLWLPSKNVLLGDMIKYADGSYHKIIDISNVILNEEVYNLSVEGTHNFYVGDQQVLVHNVKIKRLGSVIDTGK